MSYIDWLVRPRAARAAAPAALLFSIAAAAAGAGCAGVKNAGTDGAGGGSGAAGGAPGRVGLGGRMTSPPPIPPCTGPCTDFPTDPIIDPGTPANPGAMFGAPSGVGPCVTEPEPSSLFPSNWLRPRVKVAGTPGLLRFTFHADKEANDLVAYTASNSWPLPKDIWEKLAAHVVDEDITLTVAVAGGGATTVTFKVAPVQASGNMVFWAANPAQLGVDPHVCQSDVSKCSSGSELRGFGVGSETTASVLKISDVKQQSHSDSGNPAPVTCIGCHTATPDSAYVSFIDNYPWPAVTAAVSGGAINGSPYPTQTTNGAAALWQPAWGPFTWSAAVWSTGKRIGISSLGLAKPLTPDYSQGPDHNPTPNLAWINLESPNAGMAPAGTWIFPSYASGAGVDSGNALGIITRMGDSRGAATPSWSHDGTQIVYASTAGAISGRLNQGATDLYVVAFNNGNGGPATALGGAATTGNEEYYPAFAHDDQLVAFTRVPSGEVMYANPLAEIAVVSFNGGAGGAAQRLAANDPPACVASALKTANLYPDPMDQHWAAKDDGHFNNHWPKWSPEVLSANGKKYYWLIFSSNRAGLPFVRSTTLNKTVYLSQLYATAVVVSATGEIDASYGAINLWNQPTTSINTTPAWDTFSIPIIP